MKFFPISSSRSVTRNQNKSTMGNQTNTTLKLMKSSLQKPSKPNPANPETSLARSATVGDTSLARLTNEQTSWNLPDFNSA